MTHTSDNLGRRGYVLVPVELTGPLFDKLRQVDPRLSNLHPEWLIGLYRTIVTALAARPPIPPDKRGETPADVAEIVAGLQVRSARTSRSVDGRNVYGDHQLDKAADTLVRVARERGDENRRAESWKNAAVFATGRAEKAEAALASHPVQKATDEMVEATRDAHNVEVRQWNSQHHGEGWAAIRDEGGPIREPTAADDWKGFASQEEAEEYIDQRAWHAALEAANAVATPAPVKEGWTGRKCPKCNGTGERRYEDEERTCDACGGTGDEYSAVPAPVPEANTGSGT